MKIKSTITKGNQMVYVKGVPITRPGIRCMNLQRILIKYVAGSVITCVWVLFLGCSGKTIHYKSGTLLKYKAAEKNKYSVGLVLTEDFNNAVWESDTNGLKDLNYIGEILKENAEKVVKESFLNVSISSDSGSVTSPYAIFLIKPKFIGGFRKNFGKFAWNPVRTAIMVQWTIADYNGIIQKEMITGIGEGELGGLPNYREKLKNQVNLAIRDLFMKTRNWFLDFNPQEEALKKLHAYVVGQTNELRFWDDKWNLKDPFRQRLGIVEFTKKSGISQYIMGYYPTSHNNPATIEFFSQAELLLKEENVEWKIIKANLDSGEPLKPVLICVLRFEKKVLKRIIWND